ncbi:hypothetical protein [Actinomycetospora soli]|uniref:hypothetical protein n=1 Tax=Actinomycetospora soli TaxID=2893887 RepID=UPI001E5F1234|nr:hypothetical protein [Actinomycetospora soli]MCD2186574.1 hypothetical protein [Actinomycetospora soli]
MRASGRFGGDTVLTTTRDGPVPTVSADVIAAVSARSTTPSAVAASAGVAAWTAIDSTVVSGTGVTRTTCRNASTVVPSWTAAGARTVSSVANWAYVSMRAAMYWSSVDAASDEASPSGPSETSTCDVELTGVWSRCRSANNPTAAPTTSPTSTIHRAPRTLRATPGR